jgi:hypothetical protein
MTQQKDGSAMVGGWTGIGFVVTALLASFLYEQPPSLDLPPHVILEWAHEWRTGISVAMIMGVFASLLFLLFATYMHRRLADAGEDFLGSVVFGSGMLYAAFVGLTSLPPAILVFMDRQPGGITDGDVVRLLIDLSQIIYAPGTGLIGVFLLAVGMATLRAGVFSRWIGWTAIVMGLLCVAYIVPSMVNTGWHRGWAVLLYTSGPGQTVVVLILCVAILRRREQKAPQLPAKASATPTGVQGT